ncbi:MAG: hypothetical protein GC179_17545 [Anaerolineaceae bacterium]|nr:hypothetical protein [Anaerolineaceae bacterium]
MNSDSKAAIPSIIMGAAIALIVVTGLIHLVTAPENFDEAAYKGMMFMVNGVAALIAAAGIYRGSKTWGWGLGLLVAGGAIVMYVVSRTIGLPGIGIDDAWFEPIGVLSLLVEGIYVVLAIKVLGQRQSIAPNIPPLTAAG